MDHEGRSLPGPHRRSERRAIPRIDLANPEKSLLLLKPTMAMAHGGGKRFEWIRMIIRRYSAGSAMALRTAMARRCASPRLRVWSCILPWRSCLWKEASSPRHCAFHDGHTEDYTHQAVYTIERWRSRLGQRRMEL